MKHLYTCLWETYYISFLYIPNKKYMSIYNSCFVVVNSKNKRHARKVLFKLLPNKYKVKICNIKITDYPYLPDDLIAIEYDRPRHFWENQLHL
jgi:hypothetical protein